MIQDAGRAMRLGKTMDTVLSGKAPVSKRNYLQFLEAICAQTDPVACLGKIIASPTGVTAVQSAMQVDTSPTFFNGPAASLFQFLSAPELVTIGGGEYLKRILVAIVEPHIFFLTPFVDAFKNYRLEEQAQLSLAWLLLQLIMASAQEDLSVVNIIQDPKVLSPLLASNFPNVRSHAERIKHIIQTRSSGTFDDEEYGPGGRHDNDKADFREIAIIPTADEIASKQAPFMRKSIEVEESTNMETRVADYLDNLFLMLREDMIYETREELQKIMGDKRKNQRVSPIDNLRLSSVHHAIDQPAQGKWKRSRWSILLERTVEFPQFVKMSAAKRKDWLKDNRRFIKHRSLAGVLLDKEVVAFATIDRDEDLLARSPPVIVLQFEGESNTVKALLKMKGAVNLTVVPVDTPVFAYEPVLRTLQDARTLPLSQDILFWNDKLPPTRVDRNQLSIEKILRRTPDAELQDLLETPNSIRLDKSQSDSFIAGLSQSIAIIQGPPGTGKSFIGALLAKALHLYTSETILLVCFKNHALDQFLEDLLDIGVPESDMLRLGGKSTTRTEPMSLFNIIHGSKTHNYKFGRADWATIDKHKQDINAADSSLKDAALRFMNTTTTYDDIIQLIEFEDPEFYWAFKQEASADGMTRADRKGKAYRPTFLINQWSNGWDAGVFRDDSNQLEAADIWGMPKPARERKFEEWRNALLKEQAEHISVLGSSYNGAHAQLSRKYDERNQEIVRSRRIIACTTTAAAMYREEINAAAPDVVLVEEACEILESHVITALSENTKQIIMIGDHKQLRPKVNNYTLNVDSHEGFDLNRSLFERLVRRGFPHQTLGKQHRMRPEISRLVRSMTYPALVDAPGTLSRPSLRGLRDNLVFIHHEHPEDDLPDLSGSFKDNEITSKSSKQNTFEVEMVLKTLRYLGQQGYGTDKMVILTPYLGQLRALQQALRDTMDPVLNDLDSADLVRAGLLSAAAANVSKQTIRLATIDNYQGEESEIVIASLTRSNTQNMIGFMASPERVNVLLSRARDGLIIIGNAHTFQNSRSGKETWIPLFTLLKNHGHIHDGLPIRCERHQDRTALLTCPEDFERYSPDGGCAQTCGTRLACGHLCPSKCHQISDHSRWKCEEILYTPCSRGHSQQYRCHQGPPDSCFKCNREDKMAARQQKEDFERQERQDKEARRHAEEMAELDAQIASEREKTRAAQLEAERINALEQKRKDVQEAANLAALASKPAVPTQSNVPDSAAHPVPSPTTAPTLTGFFANKVKDLFSGNNGTTPASPPSPITPTPTKAAVPAKAPPPKQVSPARDEWERQKEVDGASNDAIDTIMKMSGLEKVKQAVLDIKTTVETSQRQGTSLKDKRFNICMLGNPGTGKTTVARLYAKFLASVQVLPGNSFIETTGSRMANDGVPAIQKTIQKVLEDGGGTIFCDEAYQLAGQHNFQGSKVLDFLLAEMENNVGKLVFIFAGYAKEMEKFFEHNPGLTSRVPRNLLFEDYSDEDLMDMLEGLIKKKFGGRMKVDDPDGIRGLYGRIAVRRLGRGRGRNGFGNARALQNLFDRIHERQGRRLREERTKGVQPDDFLLTKEDLIGPDPALVMEESKAYKKLHSMIGLRSVKQAVTSMLEMLKTNYQRELRELAPHQISLNRVFLGPPGTGKTTVAKHYGQILSELGLLSNGEVVVKNPADFIGGALGQSEVQTKAILANTMGKVLVIDEAYMLSGRSGGAGSGSTADPYKTAVVDTMVAEIQSTPGEDRCVLLSGYKEQMEEMFRNVNEGLSRRFAVKDAFHFNNYNDDELLKALNMKLFDQDLSATEKAKQVAINLLSRARMQSNFGNIGEVENLLSKAKINYQLRQTTLPLEERSPDAPFEPEDFDPDHDRASRASDNLAELFADVVGCEDIISSLSDYQKMAQSARTRGRDPRDLVPTNFIFKGPPGTGKTTTARKMGRVYYDMNMLSSDEVIECSATDLVGEYVGQTGPKTRELFERALGRVLFVDEAYRLAEGHFAKEAMDELVGILTDERFRAKLIVILAGYDQEMDHLLSVNTGLTSRFQKQILFRNMSPEQNLHILKHTLAKQGVKIAALDNPSAPAYLNMCSLISQLSQLRGWGNARDMNSLAREMASLAYKICTLPAGSDQPMMLPDQDAVSCVHAMLTERSQRELSFVPASSIHTQPPMRARDPQSAPPPPIVQTTQIEEKLPPPAQAVVKDAQQALEDVGRDPGVSDAVWIALQTSKAAEEEAERVYASALHEAEQEAMRAADREEEALQKLNELLENVQRAKDDAERAELMRQREQARLKAIAEREARARAEAARKAQRDAEAARRKEEVRVQAKIREMGMCVAGYRWIKEAYGYRCAGGSHFLDNAQLGI